MGNSMSDDLSKLPPEVRAAIIEATGTIVAAIIAKEPSATLASQVAETEIKHIMPFLLGQVKS